MIRRPTLLLLLGLGASARAEDRGPPGYESVVVGQAAGEGISVEGIDRREAERRGASSASDVIESSTAVAATSGTRGERIFTLRGFDQRQTSVLLDGVPFLLPYDGQVDLALLPATLLEGVTIVRGPGSVMYGPNGLGGAVNLMTRRPGSGPFAEARLEVGGVGGVRHDSRLSHRVGDLAYSAWGGFVRREAFDLSADYKPTTLEDGGRRTNSDRFFWNAGAEVAYRPRRNQEVHASFMAIDGRRGVPPSTVDPTPRFWRFTDWSMLGGTVAHTRRPSAGWSSDEVLYLRRFANTLDGYDDATYSSQATWRKLRSQYVDWVIGGRWRSQHRVAARRVESIVARSWLGVEHDRHWSDGGAPSPIESFDRTVITGAPEVEVEVDRRWAATLACQVDLEVPGAAPGWTPSTSWGVGPLGSARLRLGATLMVRATVARRTRFPTLRERFSTSFGARLPNPDLRPEAGWHMGVEATWRPRPWLLVEVAGHDAEVSDLIDRVRVEQSREQMQNVGSARLAGVEVGLRARPWRWLEARASYAWLHARRTDGVGESDRLPYRPEHRAWIGLRLAPVRWVDLSTWVNVIGPQDYQHPVSLAWGRTEARAVWGARIEVRPLPWISLWLRGSNLLDTSHESEIGYPEPGREVWVGAKFWLDPRDGFDETG